jgi:hypothetical protein
MKNKVMLAVMSVIAVVGLVGLTPAVVGASAADEIGKGANKVDTGGPSFEQSLKNIVNMMLYVLGAIAVIMIVVGGIRYATSNGESSAITGAKNTILYSVVGLVVAIMAYAIVNFVVDAF